MSAEWPVLIIKKEWVFILFMTVVIKSKIGHQKAVHGCVKTKSCNRIKNYLTMVSYCINHRELAINCHFAPNIDLKLHTRHLIVWHKAFELVFYWRCQINFLSVNNFKTILKQGRKWRMDRVGNCPPSFWQNRRRPHYYLPTQFSVAIHVPVKCSIYSETLMRLKSLSW